MAFYGSGAGLTNIVDSGQSSTTTSSDRNLSGSWVTHLSLNSFTVPSGHQGIFKLFCYSYVREGSNGGMETRFSHSGSSSANSTTCRYKRGYEDHDGGENSFFYQFQMGAGSYNFQWNVREWTGQVEMNREQNYDYFTVNYTYIRDS